MRTLQKKHKIIIGICSLVLVASIGIGISVFNKKPHADSPQPTNTENESAISAEFSNTKRDTSISVENGILKVNRTKKEESPMGPDGTWTIFMYVCGTDLESQYASATHDFDEIIDADWNSDVLKNLNIIIQTGGCEKWQSNNIPSDKICRYRVNGSSELELLETLDDASTGNPSTLENFLEWGVTNYPAKNMGVILWNHGSGPIYGSCADFKYDRDYLTLSETEYSFAKVFQKMTSKFEFIGFDACLSGNIEYANALAPYANYFIASEQTEPGDGWYYTPVMNYLISNLNCSGKDLGKIICDSYYEYYAGQTPSSDITMATYDLSKLDNAMVELNYLTKYLSDSISSNPENGTKLLRMIPERISFSTFNELVDIGSIINYMSNTNDFNYDTTYLKKAFDELICYSQLGHDFSFDGGIGITMYLPRDVISYNLLHRYRNSCFSPYHMSLIEKMTYCKNNYDWKDYIDYNWVNSPFFYEETFDFLNHTNDNIYHEKHLHKAFSNISAYASDGFDDAWFNNFSIYSPIHEKKPTKNVYNIEFEDKLTNNKTKYSSTLKKDSLKYVEAVYSTIFAKNNEDLLCLGENVQVNYDNKNGKITSTFNKEWFMLPDGQLLTTYIISTDNTSTVYAFPVMINDTEVTIRVKETKKSNGDYDYQTLGIWDSNGSDNQGARGYIPLKSGTTITPIYDVFDTSADEYTSEYGEEYTLKSDFDFLFGKLNDGEYSISYYICCFIR